ncbi:hypothetical protein QYE76_012576 [Lolium multiflorum]|uniref:Uncharacterized protein n=1 Tax=Lolium multiflorum TaxID=4521 RepID=A0AAD8U230_LOLMU|nr:hypothetical protein QYE76_012576 [Lolium multiflorum]
MADPLPPIAPILTGRISTLTRIPAATLRLVTGRHTISPPPPSSPFPLRPPSSGRRGGKGGFGSPLRGPPPPRPRDINGPGLRHVNNAPPRGVGRREGLA